MTARPRAIASRELLRPSLDLDRAIREGRRENAIDIAAPPAIRREDRQRPDPLAGGGGGPQHQPFGGEPATWRQAHQRQAAESRVRKVKGSARAAPPNSAIRSWPSASAMQAGGKEHRRLGESVSENLHHSAAPADSAPGMGAGGQREDQKEIADLRHRRIGDQQFEPRLPKREDAAEKIAAEPSAPRTAPTRPVGSAGRT